MMKDSIPFRTQQVKIPITFSMRPPSKQKTIQLNRGPQQDRRSRKIQEKIEPLSSLSLQIPSLSTNIYFPFSPPPRIRSMEQTIPPPPPSLPAAPETKAREWERAEPWKRRDLFPPLITAKAPFSPGPPPSFYFSITAASVSQE